MNKTNNSSHWERLDSVIRWANMTTNFFARHIGLSRSENLYQIKAGKNGISHSLARRIVEHFPEISIGWLLTGEGDMFGRSGARAIPLYEMDSLRGSDLVAEPEGYLSVPQLGPCDVAVRMQDEAMSGEVMVGSILFLKKTGLDAIISGGLYVIVCANYVLLRRVRIEDRGGQQCLRLESSNEDYDVMRVDSTQVEAIYRLIGALKFY